MDITGVFLKIVNMSIAASWMIVVVILLRAACRKAPKWVPPILWGLAGLRLIVPFSLKARFSLQPSVEPVFRDMGNANMIHIGSNVKIADTPVTKAVENHTTQVVASVTQGRWSVTMILGILWLTGVVVMLGFALISYLRLKRRVAESMPLMKNVRVCDHINTPFILGIIRPMIYLPTGLDAENRAYVLSHEKAHLKRWDHVWKPLGYLLLSVYWFNPLVWAAYILLSRDIEIACDEKVIEGMALPEKKAYATALVDCSMQRRMVSACPIAFGEVSVRERVKTVLNYKKPAFWIGVVALVSCAVFGVCFLTDPGMSLSHSAGKVTSVEVADSKTGKTLTITNRKEIVRIAQYVNVMELGRKGLVLGKKSGRFAIQFQPSKGKWDSFTLESEDMLYKAPFRYTVKGGNGLFGYLERLYEKEFGRNYESMTPIGVTMMAPIANSEGVYLQFSQKGKVSGELYTGDAYTLEKSLNGVDWETVKPLKDMGSVGEAYRIKENGITQMAVNWKEQYGELEPGEYRITKQIFHQKDDKTGKGYEISAEFTITADTENVAEDIEVSLPQGYLIVPSLLDSDNEAMILPTVYQNAGGNDGPPLQWIVAGTCVRYPADFTGVTFRNGIPQLSGIPMQNHTDTKYLEVIGLERSTNQWPAIMLESTHDLYTPPQLKDLEDAGTDVEKLEKTSKYWEFWFVKEGEEQYYELTLSAKSFSKEEAIKIAKTFVIK
ncbi:Signal transducer regulating beta-lactamase production, contains metallopeptidase domain [Lachnospiraceae bacterium XBB1006]|nr:Signal transducer regulating beta-lactamase production, contains metallopeptidase domain [Lachnospiraceae bacterium XBB1006]